jgi:hypothetical protein
MRKRRQNMEPTPENLKGWTLPAELPNAFALPVEFRQSLPTLVQEWLDAVEKRIDGEADELYDTHGTDIAETSNAGAYDLYRLGRRLFYTRCQQILDIMFPGRGVEVGVDLLWLRDKSTLPGGAVSEMVMDGENINSVDLSGAGVEVGD